MPIPNSIGMINDPKFNTMIQKGFIDLLKKRGWKKDEIIIICKSLGLDPKDDYRLLPLDDFLLRLARLVKEIHD